MRAQQRQGRAVPCAIGIRTHSGWAAAIVVSLENGTEQVLDRRRMEIIEAGSLGTAQPYHFAKKLGIDDAKRHLNACAETSTRLALKGVREIAEAVRDRGYYLSAAAILLSSGRPLPDLPQILASHALIHTAEGEFFRKAFRTACEEMKIPVSGLRERELDQTAKAVFGKAGHDLKDRIANLGRELGPPWTTDQKEAALAAAIALATNAR